MAQPKYDLQFGTPIKRKLYFKGEWVLYGDEQVLEIVDITIDSDYYVQYRDPYKMGVFIVPNTWCNHFTKIPKGSSLKAAKILYK